MATLPHFPNFSSVTFRKPLYSSPIYSSNAQCYRYRQSYSSIYTCSSKKPRGNKKAKSNADLCSEIRKFLSSVGLPENHVPSLKELSENGRQDLANVVRRRGYKFVGQLLEAPTETNSNTSSTDTTDQTNSEDENPKALPDNILAGEAVRRTNFNYNPYARKELKVNGKSSFAVESTTLSLEEKLAKFIGHGESQTIEDSSLGIERADEEGQESDSDDAHVEWRSSEEDLEDETRKSMNQAEVKQLEFILHQRELELIELKQQIEKEEVALSVLQTKAETEISNVQALLSEADIELQAVEQCMSGLKEVEIQYLGDGENVELAGSFDGWHHKIKMDLVPSSSVTAPTQSRTSRLWTTVLWLYPGVYEIKFIVDGRWTIDPQRESVFRGFTHNNILRVH